jgi:predicted nucleic acid-binding protein
MRLFLDANVLFTAAHNPSGKEALIIELGAKGEWEVVTSSLAVEEASRNLERTFPGAVSHLESLLRNIGKVSTVSGGKGWASLPEKDRLILTAAIDCRATHLLTGDLRHFGPLLTRPDLASGVVVQTPSDFLALRLGAETP